MEELRFLKGSYSDYMALKEAGEVNSNTFYYAIDDNGNNHFFLGELRLSLPVPTANGQFLVSNADGTYRWWTAPIE